jgi:hypothetical protein
MHNAYCTSQYEPIYTQNIYVQYSYIKKEIVSADIDYF